MRLAKELAENVGEGGLAHASFSVKGDMLAALSHGAHYVPDLAEPTREKGQIRDGCAWSERLSHEREPLHSSP